MRAPRVRELAGAGAVGAYWVAYELEAQRALGFLPTALQDFLRTDAAVVIGIAALFVLGFLVGKPWTLAVAPLPILAVALLDAGGYNFPFADTAPLTGWEVALLILGAPIVAGIVVGHLIRRIVSSVRGPDAAPTGLS